MSNFAGLFTAHARNDVFKHLNCLINNPRGTHCGRATTESMAYVAEIQRIAETIPKPRKSDLKV